MNFTELRHASRCLLALGRFPISLLVVALVTVTLVMMTLADGPIASSSFLGAENPLSENGAWVSLNAYSPYGTVFQKNNGALADRLSPLNHAASRTTATVPDDHYSEIVVGHIGTSQNTVGAIARVQTSGAAAQSAYLWWGSINGGVNNLYRLDSNAPDNSRGTTYTATELTSSSPVADGDRLRLIARGQVIYGLKNGVRNFIYNTGPDSTKYSSGTTGIMAYADGAVTNAVIASWSTGPAPASSGTWTSSTFAGTENPLDEADRWYPLPGYAGFKKAGGQVIGLNSNHNASGAWSITPPAAQYSEVTLGSVTSGGGGPIVRIDRNNPGQTGWLLFLYAGSPSSSGIYKMTPDGNFNGVQFFTPTIISGDKWRLAASGNTLTVYRNGVIQLTYTTDGSYATGDVGIEAFTPAFTFTGWEGGDTASGTALAPTITNVTPSSGLTTGGTTITINGTNFAAGATVTLGGIAATNVTVVNSSTITATTPAHPSGAVNITVANLDGHSGGMASGFTYLLPTPTVSSITPPSGLTTGGTAVTITGTNFAAGATVSIGNAAASGVAIVNSTTITATTPARAAGMANVTVTNPDGQSASLANGYLYTALSPAPPTVSSITPVSGSTNGGTAITITGTNFDAGATVSLGGTAATRITIVSSTTITATTPAQAAGAANVTVTNSDGQSASLANGYTYNNLPPIPTSSSFLGAENPLSENGAWVSLNAYSPYGTVFQKNNGALADRLSPLNHAASRTTATVPDDHYSEIVVGHIGTSQNTVGAIARVQTSGAAAQSAYLWWGSINGGVNNLYRLDSNAPDNSRGTTYTATELTSSSPVADGDRLRLIARGQVIYGLKNGVRNFIYNTGPDSTKYSSGTTGIMAYADGAVTNAVIASWSTGPAPASSGTWTSSTFAGTENPLDEADRWYPLPGYAGFKKAGGQVIGLNSNHNASGAWSITPPAAQYSEVTLGSVTSGGGGPIVRIDRNNPGQTGWLLFLYAGSPSSSGIYKMTPDGNFNGVQFFTPTIISGDKWRLAASGNTLTVYRNGVIQLTYTTDGSYATGDVGIEAFTPAFTFTGWEGGDIAGGTTQAPAPTVSNISPNTGLTAGGTAITITGANFVTGATVTLGGVAATNVTVVNSSTITATTPAGTAGAANITVTNSDGQSVTLVNGFTYSLPPPSIASVAPISGSTSGGTGITIIGTNFVTGATVFVGGTAATGVTVVNGTTITATTPAHVAGAVNVTVTNPDNQNNSLATGFTYVLPPPTVVSLAPVSGSTTGGTAITISGTNFVAGATVTLGSTAATSVTVVNSTTITATTPPGIAGTVSVTVTNPGGQSASLSNAFTYNSTAPTVSSVSPSTGLTTGGTAITITGTNFAAGATVTVGGTAASGVTFVNSTTITATTPAHAAGAVNLTVANTDGQNGSITAGFTYVLPAPTVSSVAPVSGLTTGGTAITITGSNFVAGATVNVGGTPATGVAVVNSTTITATTPAHAAGAANLTVTNTDGQNATLAAAFTYVLPAPTVTSVTPNTGLNTGGTAITIRGTNFIAGASVTLGGTAATGVTVVNSTTITATTPANPVGAVNITVTNPDAQGSTLANGFTYTAAPTLVSIAPASGLRGTVVPVTLTGTNFAATGNTVAVSGTGVTVSAITVLNSTTITANFTVAATAAISARNVTVSTSSGTSNAQTFTVLGPVLTAITPNTGARGTSVSVILTGSGLTGGTAITVSGSGVTVSGLAIVSDTTATATFTITATATLSARTVSIAALGGTSNTVAFTVVAPPVPTLVSVVPNSGVRGTAVPVTLIGTNFTAAGTRITVSGSGVTVSNLAVVDGGTLTATFTITATATISARNVSVTTPGGTSNTQVFTVQGPTLSSVTPNPAAHGTGVLLALTGTNLAGTTAVTVSGTGSTCSVTASTATTINATCTLKAGAKTVRATTPIGTTGTVALTVN